MDRSQRPLEPLSPDEWFGQVVTKLVKQIGKAEILDKEAAVFVLRPIQETDCRRDARSPCRVHVVVGMVGER